MAAIYYYKNITDYQVNANTLAYYPLNSTDTVNDLSGNNYTLTKSTNVTFHEYQGVDCAQFTSNGSSSGDCGLYRTTDTIITPQSTDLTFHVWLYKGSETMYYNPRIIGRYNSNGTIFTYAARNRISIGDSTSYGVIPDEGSWFLFSCVYNFANKTWKYYKNGVYIDTQTDSGPAGRTNTGIVLGTRDALGTGYGDKWSGGMSRVIIEKKEWSDEEIKEYYDITKGYYQSWQLFRETDFKNSSVGGFKIEGWNGNSQATSSAYDTTNGYVYSTGGHACHMVKFPSSDYSAVSAANAIKIVFNGIYVTTNNSVYDTWAGAPLLDMSSNTNKGFVYTTERWGTQIIKGSAPQADTWYSGYTILEKGGDGMYTYLDNGTVAFSNKRKWNDFVTTASGGWFDSSTSAEWVVTTGRDQGLSSYLKDAHVYLLK